MIDNRTACHLVETAAKAILDRGAFREVLDAIPAAIYVADSEGTITYYNPACVDLAGREPRLGVDQWCVTWKLYSTDGRRLPHEDCPMALAIREQRPLRDCQAIAERPDGSRFSFVPYPTPLFDAAGNFAGAVNLLREVAGQDRLELLVDQAQRCRRLAAAMQDLESAAALARMAASYEARAKELTRRAREVLDGQGRAGGETLQ